MKKSVGPMILVILLTFVACYFVASEFARTKAVNSAKKRMELEEKKLQEQKQELEEMIPDISKMKEEEKGINI